MRRVFRRAASVSASVALFCGACSTFSGSSEAPDGVDAGDDAEAGGADGREDDASADADATPLGYLLVFVSSTPHIGKFPPADGGAALDGRSGADAFCSGLAEQSSQAFVRGRKWVAWLSWGVSEADA